MKRQLVAALAVGSLVVAAGAAGAVGTGTVTARLTGGTVYVTDADIAAPQEVAGALPAGTTGCSGVADVGWCTTEAATGAVDIVDVASAPSGAALRFSTTDATGAAAMTNVGVAGTALSDVSVLSYRTLIETPGDNPAHVPSLGIEVADPTHGYVNLVWEPAAVSAGLVKPDRWQAWEPSSIGGGWWSNKKREDGSVLIPYGAGFEAVKEALPDARLLTISLKQGTANPGLVALADLLRVNGTTYDFSTSAGTTSTYVYEADLGCGSTSWCREESATGTATIERDPLAPGLEALRFSTPDQASRADVTTTSFAGRPLSSLGTLEYDTLLQQPGTGDPRQLPAFVLEVAAATSTVTLLWEPVYPRGADAATEDQWQTWSPSTEGGWWSPQNRDPDDSSRVAEYEIGTLGFDQFRATLGEVQEALGSAKILSLGVKQGTWNAGLTALVDAVRVDAVTYDFQSEDPRTQVAAAVQQVVDGAPTPQPSLPATPTADPSVSPSASPSPTGSPSPTPTPTGTATPTPTSTATATPTPDATQTSAPPTDPGSTGGTGSGGGTSTSSTSTSPSPSATAVSSSASASPSSTPTSSSTPVPQLCRATTIALAPSTIIATGATEATWTAAPGSTTVLYAYSQPSTTYRAVRRVQADMDGVARSSLRPATNTRMYALQDGCDAGFASPSVVLNVRTALTLTVKRNSVRDYTFSGDSLPARSGGLVVSLYRVTDTGRQVLTAQARADRRTGDWSLRRTFSGSGRFGFVVRTGQDLQNAPGSSNVRSLLVY